VKFEFIDAQKAHFPVDFMCQQPGVSRSGYYAWKRAPGVRATQGGPGPSRGGDAGASGEPRHVRRSSRPRGAACPRAARESRAHGPLMNERGLAARERHRFVRPTYSRHNQPVTPNLLKRDFSPGQPNRTWATDITYVGTRRGWLYLAVVMDLFSREVMGWSMSQNIDRPLVLNALDMASRGASHRGGCCTTRTGAVSTPALTTSGHWLHEASSAVCRARVTAGTTPWWRASSAA